MNTNRLEELEARLGLEFADKSFLRLALVHRSYQNEKTNAGESNERLEFLGDAVLSLVVADYLFKTFPEQSEGNLTDMRSALVRRETLDKWATAFEFGPFLLLGKGEANSGGRSRPAILAAAFEAILGALFLEQGLEAVRGWLLPLVIAELKDIITEGRHLNYKTRLQVEAQRRYHQAPLYKLVATTGPEHEPIFEVEAHVGEMVLGHGSGTTKQYAEQQAAKTALEAILLQEEVLEP